MDNRYKQIRRILNRGVVEIIDREALELVLVEGKPLRVKLGIDPTSPNIHLGRTVPLLKLKDFQDFGCQIVFVVGDFTGVIGDTSDKESERPMLSKEIVHQNLIQYVEQVGKVIDISKAEIHYNSEWLSKIGYEELGKQADVFSLNEFISRENIKKRLDSGLRVSLRELLYPLMQGYDSVHLHADVEVGGTDQRFNLLAGRQLQKTYGQDPQHIIMGPIIEGLDGRKMSSSYGNTVNLLDTPIDMYTKVMSLKDEYIITYFTVFTRIPEEIVQEYSDILEHPETNPRDIKMKLAYTLVSMYHSQDFADEAQEYFIQAFTKKEIPEKIAQFHTQATDLIEILVDIGFVISKSEARRVIQQGGVKINGAVVQSQGVVVHNQDIIQKGKKDFIQVILES